LSTWNELTAARTLWQEARGEPKEGQRAVAHVLWNRVRSGRWGETLASVCLWRAQFSGWSPIDPNYDGACELADTDVNLQNLLEIVIAAASEPDPTDGATHYYATSMKAAPAWVIGATFCGQFGNQRFYKNVK